MNPHLILAIIGFSAPSESVSDPRVGQFSLIGCVERGWFSP